METAATYRGTVYPWPCDRVGHMNIMWYVGKFETGEITAVCEITGIHMDRQALKSAAFAETIRRTPVKQLAFPDPVCA